MFELNLRRLVGGHQVRGIFSILKGVQFKVGALREHLGVKRRVDWDQIKQALMCQVKEFKLHQ